MKTQTHSALVRGEDGGLAVRRFTSRADAAAAESSREVAPESALKIEAVLPEILDHMRLMQSRKLRVLPLPAGGYEIELVQTNQLYVSRQELAEMMPRFSENSDPARYVDELVKKGLPHVRATGSAIFNVPKVVAWLEKWFALGGTAPVACLLVLVVFFGASQAEARVEQGPPAAVAIEALPAGSGLLRIEGNSMQPHLRPGVLISVEAVTMGEVRVGDVIVFQNHRLGKLVAHRVVRPYGQFWVTQGDANRREDTRLVSALNLRFRMRGVVKTAQAAP